MISRVQSGVSPFSFWGEGVRIHDKTCISVLLKKWVCLDRVLFKIINVALFVMWCIWNKKVIENIKKNESENVFMMQTKYYLKKVSKQFTLYTICRVSVNCWYLIIASTFIFLFKTNFVMSADNRNPKDESFLVWSK